jgi:threonine synthase
MGDKDSMKDFYYYYVMNTQSLYSHLECLMCKETFAPSEVHSYCPTCTQPLVARYDLKKGMDPSILANRPQNMWRYKELLPIMDDQYMVSLGEGMTDILDVKKLQGLLKVDKLQFKDESGNPTGSFKARGLSMAVSKAYEMGLKEFCIPTAGNAGSALSAYVAKMDGISHVFMPEATPSVFQIDCEIMGAKVRKIPGSIKDAGAAMAAQNKEGQWWDVTTLKEPFRLEGKKTMGFEIAEQLNWKLPDVIIYPTGGGTGLIGIWKAFQEMKELGWIDHIPSRMVAVQTTGCNPIVTAFQKKEDHAPLFENPAETIANGLRVPKAFGDRLIMTTLYESNGYAIDVSDEEIRDAMGLCARTEGLFLSPEGAAVLKAAFKLKDNGFIKSEDHVLLLNTGSAYKYIENL